MIRFSCRLAHGVYVFLADPAPQVARFCKGETMILEQDIHPDDPKGTEAVILPEPSESTVKEKKQILIVDDDNVQNEILAFCFEKIGYDSAVATCGETGFAKAKEIRPDLILLDIEMPGISGLEVCRQLVDCPETYEIPIIILSGHEGGDVVRDARSAGCHYFVRKPYDPNALLTLVQAAMEESSGW